MKPKFLFLSVSFFLFFIGLIFSYFSANNYKLLAQEILKPADVEINGSRPHDIVIHNKNVYERVLQEGSLGLGESYMNGWWDCPNLDEFFFKIFSCNLDEKIKLNWALLLSYMKAKLLNLQSKSRAFVVGEEHYDLSNELFKNMLDPLMIYSCGYWKNAHDLTQAQENKLDLICKKLYLKPGMKVLDIGCGWGGLAHYIAQKCKVEVTGITISKEQAGYAQEQCKNDSVKILLIDYRDLNDASKFADLKKSFDRIISIGMFEHVGYKNYKEFMSIVHGLLKDDGLFLLHTIGTNVPNITGDPWINKYIFPNGMLPSISQISSAFEGLFVMEDWHNFSADYDRTLLAWYDNFINNWKKIKLNFDDRFFRMWKYYLLSCAAQFRARKVQLWQIVFSKKGVPGGYISIR